MELAILFGAFAIGAVAGIAIMKLQGKASDGKIDATDIISAITEAEDTFNEFCSTIKSVIKNPDINNEDTIKYIEEAVEVVQAAKSLTKK